MWCNVGITRKKTSACKWLLPPGKTKMSGRLFDIVIPTWSYMIHTSPANIRVKHPGLHPTQHVCTLKSRTATAKSSGNTTTKEQDVEQTPWNKDGSKTDFRTLNVTSNQKKDKRHGFGSKFNWKNSPSKSEQVRCGADTVKQRHEARHAVGRQRIGHAGWWQGTKAATLKYSDVFHAKVREGCRNCRTAARSTLLPWAPRQRCWTEIRP